MLVLAGLVGLAVWGYFAGTGGGTQSFDLQNVPMFRDCGKTGPDYTAKDTIVLETCTWKVLNIETAKTAGESLRATGRFLLLQLQLKNTGTSDAILTGVEVELIDTDNISKIYDPQENNAALEALGRDSILKGRVGRGETIRGWVVFDIGANAQNLKLRVRDIDVTKSSAANIDLSIGGGG